MGKYVKILSITLFVLLVVFAAIADRPIISKLLNGLQLAPYLRLVSILGLIVAVFLAWGYKRKIEASQKFVRAQEVLDQAGEKAERSKKECERLELNLKAEYERKRTDLDANLSKIKDEYEERLRLLKEQNMELKESVAELMQRLKKKNAN